MIEKEPILAIETSQSCCSACVHIEDNKFFEMNVNFKNLHAEKIFEIIDSVIRTSGIAIKDLGAIAVSSGPGSFTGLRIGMSAAKGIAFGVSLPIIAVPTFEALALQLSNALNDGTEFIITNNVNSEEIYFAKFQVKSNNYIFARDLQIMRKADDIQINDDCLIFGNANLKHIPAERMLNITYPKAEYVAKWAKSIGDSKLSYDFDFLEPNYLKNFIVKDKSI